MLGAIIWWIVDAHKWFKGPRVNVEHAMLGREGNVVDGVIVKDPGDAASSSGASGDGVMVGEAEMGRREKRLEV